MELENRFFEAPAGSFFLFGLSFAKTLADACLLRRKVVELPSAPSSINRRLTAICTFRRGAHERHCAN